MKIPKNSEAHFSHNHFHRRKQKFQDANYWSFVQNLSVFVTNLLLHTYQNRTHPQFIVQ